MLVEHTLDRTQSVASTIRIPWRICAVAIISLIIGYGLTAVFTPYMALTQLAFYAFSVAGTAIVVGLVGSTSDDQLLWRYVIGGQLFGMVGLLAFFFTL